MIASFLAMIKLILFGALFALLSRFLLYICFLAFPDHFAGVVHFSDVLGIMAFSTISGLGLYGIYEYIANVIVRRQWRILFNCTGVLLAVGIFFTLRGVHLTYRAAADLAGDTAADLLKSGVHESFYALAYSAAFVLIQLFLLLIAHQTRRKT